MVRLFPPPPSEAFSIFSVFLAESLRLPTTGSIIPLAPTCTTLLSTSDYLSHLASPPKRRPLNARLLVPSVPLVRSHLRTQKHNKHLKNNTKAVSLVSCFYHVLHGYYSGFVVVRTKSKTCQNLPIFPPKLCQRIDCLHLSLMFLFSVLICALVAGGAFIPATVTDIILFPPNITFQSVSLFFFFFLDHEISHI